MDATIEFEASPQLAMAAYRTSLVDWLVRRFYWPLSAIAVFVILVCVRADGIWVGALGGFIVVRYVWPFVRAAFRPRAQWSSKQLRGMTDLTLRYTFMETGVSFESQMSGGSLRWAAFERFCKGRTASLLLVAGCDSSFHYFPTAQLTPDIESLIRAKIGLS